MRPHRMLLWFVLPSLLATSATTVGAQWQVDGGPVCTAVNTQAYPKIVSDGAGGAIVTWQDLRGGVAYDIYAQHVLASGAVDPAWPADGRALCTAGERPGRSEDRRGRRGRRHRHLAGHRSGANCDIYAQHVLASGAVDPAWPANGRALCTAAGNQELPDDRPRRRGRRHRHVGGLPQRHRLRHLRPARAGLGCGGPRLAGGRPRPVHRRRTTSGTPAIVSDGAGGAIVTWYDDRGRELPTSTPSTCCRPGRWTRRGRPTAAPCAPPRTTSYDPTIVTDGAGGADRHLAATTAAARLRHLRPARAGLGGRGPGVAGGRPRAVHRRGRPATSPRSSRTASGGAIVAWQDQRSGVGFDIYAQHVLASGTVDPAWPRGRPRPLHRPEQPGLRRGRRRWQRRCDRHVAGLPQRNQQRRLRSARPGLGRREPRLAHRRRGIVPGDQRPELPIPRW